MANILPKQCNAPKQVVAVPPRPSEATRYTNEEVNALTELVVKYQDVLKGKGQSCALVQKNMWMQFSQYLHSRGWPKRHWTRLRRKGQLLLKKLDAVTNSQQPVPRGSLKSTQVSSSGSSQLVGERCGLVSSHILVTHSFYEMKVSSGCSDVLQLNLPSSTPSPVVSIASEISTSFSHPTDHVQLNPTYTTGPRIVNTFSTAVMPQQFTTAHDLLHMTTKNQCNDSVSRVALLSPVSA